MATKKDLSYYMNLPWSYTIEKEYDHNKRYYIIRVNELPGICTDGETIEEVMENIKEAIEGAISLYLELGDSSRAYKKRRI